MAHSRASCTRCGSGDSKRTFFGGSGRLGGKVLIGVGLYLLLTTHLLHPFGLLFFFGGLLAQFLKPLRCKACGHTYRPGDPAEPLPPPLSDLHGRVESALAREGRDSAGASGETDPQVGEPPCPACGAQGPLADGACADCGLRLA